MNPYRDGIVNIDILSTPPRREGMVKVKWVDLINERWGFRHYWMGVWGPYLEHEEIAPEPYRLSEVEERVVSALNEMQTKLGWGLKALVVYEDWNNAEWLDE